MRPFVCRLVPLEKGRPTWLHLVPYGHWEGHHSKRPVDVTIEGGRQILANFAKRGIKLVVDWEHQTLASMVNGQPAPAAGWIDQLELRDDGVWGHVDAWTARAAAQLDGDPPEYRYLSPVIELSSVDPRTGAPEGLWLSSVALTNVPFFAGELSPVVARGTPNMNLLTLLLGVLELPPETTEEQAIEAVKSLKALPKEPTEDPVMAARAGLGDVVAAKLGWDKKLPKDAAKIVAKALDHEGYVPETEVLTLRAQLAALEAAQGNEGVSRLVARGIETGKLTPAFKGHFEALAKRDLVAATAWLDSAPVIIPNGPQVVKNKIVAPTELTPTEALACKNLGMDPKAYIKARAATTA